MTISAATLRLLVDAGLTGDRLVAVVESIESDQQKPRSSGAERQARYRERHNVTSQVTSQSDVTEPSPEEKVSPIPPSKTQTPTNIPPSPPSGAHPPTDRRGSRLPDGWSADIGVAIELGLTKADAISEEAKFCDYWRAVPGQRGVKLDWQATWRNWCRRAASDRRTTGPPASQGNAWAALATGKYLDEPDTEQQSLPAIQ